MTLLICHCYTQGQLFQFAMHIWSSYSQLQEDASAFDLEG